MKFSVIVPIYNSEIYLEECLDSILNQSERDFELLLVDDGSFDRSKNICDEYAKKDDRIKVFHNENHGVSYSRNYALERANGEYIIFVDSDDKLKEDGLENLVGHDCDLLIYDYERLLGDRTIFCPANLKVLPNYLIEERSKTLLLSEFFTSYKFNPIWRIRYRKELIKDIRFDEEMITGEDLIFNLNAFDRAKSFFYLDTSLYLYRKNENSCVHSFKEKKYDCLKKTISSLKSYSVKWGYGRLNDHYINKRYISNVESMIRSVKDKRRRKDFLERLNKDEQFKGCLKEFQSSKITFKEKIKVMILKNKTLTKLFMR